MSHTGVPPIVLTSVFVTVVVEIEGSVASMMVVVSDVDICVMLTIGSNVKLDDSDP